MVGAVGLVIGVPKEIKSHEYRVGLVPSGVSLLVSLGHKVVLETQSGSGVFIEDSQYIEAGASILSSAEKVFEASDMIVKVKEPQPNECKMIKKGQLLFTFLHLAPDALQTKLLLESGCTAVAYETVSVGGELPLLAPMSEIAGKVAAQAGAKSLEKSQGGRGVLLGGVPGVSAGVATVIGAGVVGMNAARVLLGMGADVYVVDNNISRLREVDRLYPGDFKTMFSNKVNIKDVLSVSDVVVGAVLVHGAAAPKVVSRNLLKSMKKGSVIVDVAIDQGGCFETSRPTTHENPLYEVDGVVHYCVTNMPGAVPVTSTYALTNATLPFVVRLAGSNVIELAKSDPVIGSGVNIHNGMVTYEAVASALGYEFCDIKTIS